MTDTNVQTDTEASEHPMGNEGHGASRGEFLKWGTVALSGLYVGPKVTSFAVQSQLGHAGSVPVRPIPPVPPPIQPVTPIYPATGGAANLTPAQRKALKARDRDHSK